MNAWLFGATTLIGLVAFIHFANMAFSGDGKPHDIAGACFGIALMLVAIANMPGQA